MKNGLNPLSCIILHIPVNPRSARYGAGAGGLH